MLEFHPLRESPASPARLAQLLELARTTLVEQGMASMDEYGDMLKWPLPANGDWWRNIHVFHPDWCSFSDQYRGTIHYHAGTIRGTVLLGAMEHYTYAPTPSADGDRFLNGQAYKLTRHTNLQRAGTSYELPGMVAHWLKPTELTLTYFEEYETGKESDLVNPATDETDEHTWEQEDAEALTPELLARIDERLTELRSLQVAAPTA